MPTLIEKIDIENTDEYERLLIVEDYHVAQDAPDAELNRAHVERCDEQILAGLVTF